MKILFKNALLIALFLKCQILFRFEEKQGDGILEIWKDFSSELLPPPPPSKRREFQPT